MPEKSSFTLTEIVILSIVWASTSFVWTNVLKQGLTMLVKPLGLSKYATDIVVASILLAAIFALVLLFSNVQVGKSSVFQIVDLPMTVSIKTEPDGAPLYG